MEEASNKLRIAFWNEVAATYGYKNREQVDHAATWFLSAGTILSMILSFLNPASAAPLCLAGEYQAERRRNHERAVINLR
ncbi:hypothetical protein [Gluconobacter thailandicus]|uniref:hypothetical protein n=1 Tax=Gluconobacter thailandicus TaxID=257438 RepID=UPI00054EFB36|nr:hypothetical protein [Gluconobacter thailandicus]KXV52513.1 hypothetical protein AD946_12400 [Gluconobacter thailandicus]